MAAVPPQMRALVLDAYAPPPVRLRVEARAVPEPRPGEVLVRVSASPVNPSDLAFLQGGYAIRPDPPVVPGLEASGLVVAAGGGLVARRLKGRRVACSPARTGTWAEYVAVPAMRCVPLPGSIDDRAGAMSLVNPIAAIGMVGRVRELGARGFVNTAAAGALGHMLQRLAMERGLDVVNVVRRPEHAQRLRAEGAKRVLDSSAADFAARLAAECREAQATVALDAIAGPMTDLLLAALPPGSTVIVYGGLSVATLEGVRSDVDISHLIFRDKRVEGFYVPTYLSRMDLPRVLLLQRRVTAMLGSTLASDVREEVGLEGAAEAIERYRADMSAGKLLIRPSISG